MDEICQVVNWIPAWKTAREIQVERIAGLTNANYRVNLDGERYVVRLSGKNTERLGTNRIHEAVALRSAAAASFGPEVVAFIQPEGHLVTRWVEGRHWEYTEFRTPDNVRLLTETVKRIHALPPNGAVFSPFQRVLAYMETAHSFAVPLPAGFERCLETMGAVQVDEQRDIADWKRFCHNDLVSVNYLYLEAEQRIIVLDWEFAGLGDIYYDLATVVYTHDSEGPISTELEQVMLACYFGETTPWQQRRLLGMKYMLMLFTGMWGLAQHGMQKGGLIAAVEGFDYLEFAEYLFSHDIPQLAEQYRQTAGRDSQ
jgi:thiamine kinase-like enzyme